MPLTSRRWPGSLALALILVTGTAAGAVAGSPAAVVSAGAPATAGLTAAGPAAATGSATTPVYRADPWNIQPLTWDQLWLNDGPIAHFTADGHTDANGIPMKKWIDKKFYYSPVRIALQGLARLNSYVQTGMDPNSAYIPTLNKLDQALQSMAVLSNGAWFFSFPFDDPYEKLTAPWYNAMANGFALMFFTRMHRIFGDPADLQAANFTFNSFSQIGPSKQPWVSMVENGYLWLEHYPAGIHYHVLNAHLHTLFGLYDYYREVNTPEALHVLDGAISTMRYNLHRFRRPGKPSYYCLVKPTISNSYHLLHIKQVRQLALVTGDSFFTVFANRLYRDFH